MKVCPQCQTPQPETCFGKDKHRPDGLNPYCKVCVRNRSAKQRSNQDLVSTQKTSLYVRTYRFKALGVDVNWNTIDQLIESQKNKCAICKKPESVLARKGDRPRELAIDHDHKTGVIRGLLCFRCNTLLGKVGDDINLLQSMIEYLSQNHVKSNIY